MRQLDAVNVGNSRMEGGGGGGGGGGGDDRGNGRNTRATRRRLKSEAKELSSQVRFNVAPAVDPVDLLAQRARLQSAAD